MDTEWGSILVTTIPGAGTTVTFNGREDWSEMGTPLLMHDSTRKTAHGSAKKKEKMLPKNQVTISPNDDGSL